MTKLACLLNRRHGVVQLWLALPAGIHGAVRVPLLPDVKQVLSVIEQASLLNHGFAPHVAVRLLFRQLNKG